MRKTIQSNLTSFRKKSLVQHFVSSVIVFLFSVFFYSGNSYAETASQIALFGEAKYTDDFSHFDYVNPLATKGGKIVMPDYGGFDNFNPFIFKGMAPSSVPSLTLDTLGVVPTDDFSTVYPLIAKEFELPEDRSYVGFILDERAKFSDGTPVLAEDVIFSFNALTEKGSPIYRLYYSDVVKVVEIDNHHVRFFVKKGVRNKELPLILAQFPIFSKSYWEGKDFSQPKLEPYLGSGPYRIHSFDAGKYITFKKNPDYWAKDLPSRKGFFNFDEVRFDYYQDTTVTLQALFSGNIDLREEYISKIWATGYDNELVKSGKIIKAEIYHPHPATTQNFSFNTRKDKFKDRRVREAIGLAFNFDWANDKLFYNQYERLYSFFSNTEMAATGLPKGLELSILNRHKKQLPPSVFTKSFANPSHKNSSETRNNLKRAVELLQEAGYGFQDGQMVFLETGEPLDIEVLSNTANGTTFVRVMLPFIKNLEKIGIKMTFRNLEVSVFKNRLDNFDFDMAIASLRFSRMPGNELKDMLGSDAANTKGSYNIIGIQNKVVDSLINGLIEADEKKELVAYAKALDRVLLNEHYVIMQWYSSFQRVAYWDKFGKPDTSLKIGFQPDTWWRKEGK